MKQIKIGTCVPGREIMNWVPHLAGYGFETIEFYYDTTLGGADFGELSKQVREAIGDSGMEVSSIGLYCNPLQFEEQRKELEYCIDHAHLFGAKVVSTFAGAVEGAPVEAALPKFKEVFSELAKRARDKNLKIGIENWPAYGMWYHTTKNIGFCPKAWKMMFNEVPDENLGLEWEPTHQMEQLIDPIAQLREWVGKIVHVHGKDATIDRELLKRHGVLSGMTYTQHRTPGFGDSNWRDILSILHMGGYEGDICIEGFHDPVYRGEWEMTGQLHALKYLKWCRGSEFVANPWDCEN